MKRIVAVVTLELPDGTEATPHGSAVFIANAVTIALARKFPKLPFRQFEVAVSPAKITTLPEIEAEEVVK